MLERERRVQKVGEYLEDFKPSPTSTELVQHFAEANKNFNINIFQGTTGKNQ